MYIPTKPEDELRQGDIFTNLPWLLYDPCKVGTKEGAVDIASSGFSQPQLLVVQAEPATGIIISADCSSARDSNLTLCRVRPITDREPSFHEKNLANKLKYKLKLQRTTIGTFYLRQVGDLPDSFTEFSELLSFTRAFLLRYRHNRVATLTEEARHHLREKIAYHQTRFGPDERYIFTEDEMETVLKEKILE